VGHSSRNEEAAAALIRISAPKTFFPDSGSNVGSDMLDAERFLFRAILECVAFALGHSTDVEIVRES